MWGVCAGWRVLGGGGCLEPSSFCDAASASSAAKSARFSFSAAPRAAASIFASFFLLIPSDCDGRSGSGGSLWARNICGRVEEEGEQEGQS